MPLVPRSSARSAVRGCMAGRIILGSLVPVALPSGLSPPQPPAICKRLLAAALPAPETCPRNSLTVQPQPWPHTGAAGWLRVRAPGHCPHESWQEREFGTLPGLAAVGLSAVQIDAEHVRISSSFCCTNPPGPSMGIFLPCPRRIWLPEP